MGSRPKGFLVFRITRDQLQLAHRTAAGWQETLVPAHCPGGRPNRFALRT